MQRKCNSELVNQLQSVCIKSLNHSKKLKFNTLSGKEDFHNSLLKNNYCYDYRQQHRSWRTLLSTQKNGSVEYEVWIHQKIMFNKPQRFAEGQQTPAIQNIVNYLHTNHFSKIKKKINSISTKKNKYIKPH